jgi:hypothetical protein
MSSSPAHIQAFLTKWQASGGAERANAQTFLTELCDILEVERPQPKTNDEHANAYVFEKTIPSVTDTSNFIDLYKRGCFVLETKQGTDRDNSEPLSAAGLAAKKNLKTGHGVRDTKAWGVAMMKAREQAQRYARALPKEEITEGRPPFVLVVDVGHSIALYTDWSRMGGEYVAFPDPTTFRIPLRDLLKTEVRELLRAVWIDPLSLDPGRRSAKVTRDIADSLAKLARSLEGKHSPEQVANFLMRCLFTMFSEDVDLLPHGSFTALLGNLKKDPESFVPAMESLWQSMNTGGYAAILQKKLPRFNGGLFAHADAIDLNADQIQLLIEASTANWKDVEPAIFGTLLERALDPRERHKLGAHYTPRAYVERLVNPTVIEPLRPATVRRWQRQEERGEGREAGGRVPLPAGQHPRAGPRLRQWQLPVRDAGTAETPGGRGAEHAAGTERQGDAGVQHPHAEPRQLLRHRTEPPRRRHCRTGAVDRFPAMAVAHPRQPAHAARTHHQGPAQHREPRCRTGLRHQDRTT